MEPPSLDGGDLPSFIAAGAGVGLQWSRRLSTAETCGEPLRAHLASCCFNGAAVSRRRRRLIQEDANQPPGHCFNGAAVSRRRRPRADASRWQRWVRASMEPPSLDGGDSGQSEPVDTGSARLQWSRRLSTAETPGAGRASCAGMGFNGAAVSRRRRPAGDRRWLATRTSLQWSRRLSTAETPRTIDAYRGPASASFNGAAVSRRRRRSRVRELNSQHVAASMEPPSLDGGDLGSLDVVPRHACAVSFNGAAVSRRRRHAERLGPRRAWLDASMEPPSLDGGDIAIPSRKGDHRARFNGAAVSRRRRHAGRPSGSPARWCCFNGAAVSRRRRPPGRCLGSSATAELQWSRRLSTAETPRSGPGLRARVTCFNGAAVSRRRRPVSRTLARTSLDLVASMEPPSLDGGDVAQAPEEVKAG